MFDVLAILGGAAIGFVIGVSIGAGSPALWAVLGGACVAGLMQLR